MRRVLILTVVLGITALGNTGILFAGDVGSGKEYGLSQWTREGREQTPQRVAKEKYGLSQWTREGREQEQTYLSKEKYGLCRWTRLDEKESLAQKKGE